MKMETFLRKTLGLKSHRITGVEETDMELLVHIERIDRRALICSGCSRPVRATRGQNRKTRWRGLPVGGRGRLSVVAPVAGSSSRRCLGRGKKMHITYSLAKVAALLARKMSYQEVAEYLGLQWR